MRVAIRLQSIVAMSVHFSRYNTRKKYYDNTSVLTMTKCLLRFSISSDAANFGFNSTKETPQV